MGRKVRILQFPLQALDAGSASFSGSSGSSAPSSSAWTNPLLSHWGLLIGETDLLVEIFPKSGKTAWTPLLTLSATQPAKLKDRKGTFKFGIFPQSDTELSNEEIIRHGQEIVQKNKFYNLALYNCQTFVNDLAEKIAPPGFVTTVKKAMRWIPILSKIVNRDGDEDGEPDPAVVENQMKAEIAALQALQERWAAPILELEPAPSEPAPSEPAYVEPNPDPLFQLGVQQYLAEPLPDSLQELGVVYAMVENPTFVVAGVDGATDPTMWSDVDHKALKVAEGLVGEDF